MDSDKRIALKMGPIFVVLMFLRPYMFSEIISQFCYRYLWRWWIQISVLLWNCTDVRDSDVFYASSVPNNQEYYCKYLLFSAWATYNMSPSRPNFFPHKIMLLPHVSVFTFKLKSEYPFVVGMSRLFLSIFSLCSFFEVQLANTMAALCVMSWVLESDSCFDYNL
jgi:hypothetical protein